MAEVRRPVSVGAVLSVVDDEVGDLCEQPISCGQVVRVDVALHLVNLELVLAGERGSRSSIGRRILQTGW